MSATPNNLDRANHYICCMCHGLAENHCDDCRDLCVAESGTANSFDDEVDKFLDSQLVVTPKLLHYEDIDQTGGRISYTTLRDYPTMITKLERLLLTHRNAEYKKLLERLDDGKQSHSMAVIRSAVKDLMEEE